MGAPPLAAAAAEGSGAPAFLTEVAALLIAAAVAAYVASRLRQLPIVGFLLAGVVIGPNAVGLVRSIETVNAAAELGVILLLFTIGIEFSLDRLSAIRRLIVGGGSLQVVLAIAATAGLCLAVGASLPEALFSGMLVALSSTAIVLKLLAERGRTDSRGGRVQIALLIFQDLAIVAFVLMVPMQMAMTTSRKTSCEHDRATASSSRGITRLAPNSTAATTSAARPRAITTSTAVPP